MNQYEKIESTCYVTEKDHKYYKNDGTPLDLQSVSELVATIYPYNYKQVPERVLNNAALRGTCVHQRMENYIKTKEVEECAHNEYKHELMFNRLKKKIDEMEYDHIFSEISLFNDIYTGTFDLLVVKDDTVTMYDFKTTSKPHKQRELLQLVFYAKLLEENYNIKVNNYAIMNSNINSYYRFNEKEFLKEEANFNKVIQAKK